MLRCLGFHEGRLAEMAQEEASVFIYISPDEAERKFLVDHLKIDEHTLSSSLDPDELARLEFEPEHLALIFVRPKSYMAKDNFLFRVLPTGVFIFRDRMIIILTEDTPIFEGKHLARVQNLHDLLLRMLYRAISHFTEHLKVINAISGELEQRINTSMENRYLLNMFTLEKSLVYYLNAISANSTLIEKLRANTAKLGLNVEQIELLDDLMIENKQCYRQAEIYSQVLSSLMDARASIVSNNLNQLIKTLTFITIAIMTPTLVVSIFSMNVRLPVPQMQALWPFFSILGLALISAGLVYLFRYLKKW